MVPAIPSQKSSITFGLGGQITTMVPDTQLTLYAPATPTEHSTVITGRGGLGLRVMPEIEFHLNAAPWQPSPQVPPLTGGSPDRSLASGEERVKTMGQLSTPTSVHAPYLLNDIFPEYDSDSTGSPRPVKI